jgi:hypothetical protein
LAWYNINKEGERTSSKEKVNKMIKFYEKIVCADGFSMSVQASDTHYSLPRNDSGPYTSVEVGYPSSEDSILLQYAENPDRPTETIYSWVPIETVQQCIEAHGGMVSGELPPFALM